METIVAELRLTFIDSTGAQRILRLARYDTDLTAAAVEALAQAIIGADVFGQGAVRYYAELRVGAKVATTTSVIVDKR
ncbi:DUF2922 family protein [Lacticaseibacillus absianus]|uniref:DUF2922 family protein n=1 Tax=Lacticaseibacillus absianus TaxID=2729623 RepID=UPI0015C976C7|nr:DUF2922 family protein [Lacticaseibacillus absianus]